MKKNQSGVGLRLASSFTPSSRAPFSAGCVPPFGDRSFEADRDRADPDLERDRDFEPSSFLGLPDADFERDRVERERELWRELRERERLRERDRLKYTSRKNGTLWKLYCSLHSRYLLAFQICCWNYHCQRDINYSPLLIKKLLFKLFFGRNNRK